MRSYSSGIKTFVREEDSPTMVEYGLLLALIALLAAVAVSAFGVATKETLFDTANDYIDKL